MISAERTAFLDAIRANPDDDLVRLVFADWLDEHGEAEFADFIRFQIDKARQPVANPLLRAMEESHESYRPGSPVTFLGLPTSLSGKCRGGFIAEVTTGPQTYLDWADQIGPYAPRLTVHLRVQCGGSGPPVEGRTAWMTEMLDRLARCPWLQTWFELAAPHYGIASPAMARLAASPHAGGLQHLNLQSNWLGPDPGWVVEAKLTGLRALNLGYNLGDFERNRNLSEPRPGDPVLAAIARARWATNLEVLDYSANSATADGVREIAASTVLSRLRELSLMHNAIGDDGLRALAATTLTALTDLNVADCRGLTADGFTALFRSPLMGRITSLRLGGPQMDDGIVRDLAHSPQSRGLTRLSLWHANTVTADGARAILGSPYLSGLKDLALIEVPLDEDAAARLADPETLPQLERLVITLGANIPDQDRSAADLRRRFGDKVRVNYESQPDDEIDEDSD